MIEESTQAFEYSCSQLRGSPLRLLVTSEYRFSKSPDGQVWTQTAFPYAYWTQFLKNFEEVTVLARTTEISRDTAMALENQGWKRVTGPKVSFAALPSYRGPKQFLFTISKIFRFSYEAISKADRTLVALPSPIGTAVALICILRNRPLGAEVLGDPWEVLSKQGVKHPLRPVLRFLLTFTQKIIVKKSYCTAFVTQSVLQKRYPPRSSAFSIGVSNIELRTEHIARQSRDYLKTQTSGQVWRLVSVGSLEQLYKGPDIVLRAMDLLKKKGLRFELVWAGGGIYLEPITLMAKKLGLAQDAKFLGVVSGGDAVRRVLDDGDIFVLASRTEGLPRALIEAMARGLVCLGSRVGGIPELLNSSQLFEPESPEALAEALEKCVANREEMQALAQQNLEKSQEFQIEKLQLKRSEFIEHLNTGLDRKSR